MTQNPTNALYWKKQAGLKDARIAALETALKVAEEALITAKDAMDEAVAQQNRADALAAHCEALRTAMSSALYAVEALKLPCPMDPEAPQSQRNGVYASIALNIHKALSSTPAASLEAITGPLEANNLALREAISWVLYDAKYKAPEQFFERSEVWWDRLQSALAQTYAYSLEAHDAKVREALEARVDDLSMLVRQLVHSLNKYNPGSSTATRAMDYLHRNCLQGSILRSSESQDAHDARVRREALGTSGIEAIAAERKRQIEQEGWTPEHDDEHGVGELAAAAACYTVAAIDPEGITPLDQLPIPWPWAPEWYKPANPRGALVKAGALIAAEIDRLDRMGSAVGPAPEGETTP